MLRANPASLQFVALGEALRSRERHPEAAAALLAGLAIHPDLRSAQAVLARVYAHTGARQEALELLGRLVSEDPHNTALACLQIELQLAEGCLDEATTSLNLLEARSPSESSLRRLRAQLTAQRRTRRQGDPYVSLALAVRLEEARWFEQALAVLDALVATTGDEAAAARAKQLREMTMPSLEEEDVVLGRGSDRAAARLRRWLEALDGAQREETR
ncbi:MAG: putative Zn-dependent protease [Myxococcota bacterium]|jgi:predicted Zn-dependent protease